MRNEISFYYNLNAIKIHQQQDKIIFYTSEKKYILCRISDEDYSTIDLYKLYNYLLTYGIYCHKIILNINNDIITIIRNNKYILLEVNMPTKKVDIEDIRYLSSFKINLNDFKNLKRENWKKLWEKKVDYIEYEISEQKNKYKDINEHIDFLIGVTETCISLLDTTNTANTFYSINHNRITSKMTTDDFYNPVEFIIDIRVRDYGEYIKNLSYVDIQIKEIEYIINNAKLNENEIILFLIRILFPSSFFDVFEKISKKSENININNEIKKIIEEYNFDKKKIYSYIKSISKIPTIEWLTSE